jgi:hypothetical protein
MVAGLVLIVNHYNYLLTTYSNSEARIRMRVAEVKRLQGVAGIETV